MSLSTQAYGILDQRLVGQISKRARALQRGSESDGTHVNYSLSATCQVKK